MSEFLFNGKIEGGRLSNQEQIIENVPEEFVEGNVWYDHIKALSKTGGPVFNMGWRRRREYTEATWDHLLHCFQAISSKSHRRLCRYHLHQKMKVHPQTQVWGSLLIWARLQ